MIRFGGPTLVLGTMFLSGAAHADVSLSPLFADHMVLQRDKKIAVWGKATPAEKVVISISNKDLDSKMMDGKARLIEKSANVVADAGGHWKVELPPIAGGGPFLLDVKGNNEIKINDVYFGEVWVASGQSNMQFTLDRATNGEAEIKAANFPLIREFNAQVPVAATPQEEIKGQWMVCSPDTAKQFSAVAYFFARELQQKLNCPIGILHASQGWTPGEAWMSREALSSDPGLKRDVLDKWDEIARIYPAASAEYTDKMKAWQIEADKAKAEGRDAPPQPKGPKDPNFIHRATGLWNGAIAPLTFYPVRGVIWYQGETNDNRGFQYRTEFPALIKDWRKNWNDPQMPFLFVQLASVLPPDPEPVESEWSEVREAQAMALKLPATGMAVTIDIGEEKDVHPKDKQDVGHRLALNALAKVYNYKIEYSGPLYKSMKVEGNAIRLSFDDVNQGLVTFGGTALDGFDIAGADKKFVHATARVDGNTIVVSSDAVAAPVAVRYAWANNPMGRANVGSKTKDGAILPASPFRTDDWPGKSFGNVKMPIDDM